MIARPEYSENTRYRIVSDLHLGHEKSYFHHLDQLRFLLDGCDTLICLGDTAETRVNRFQQRGFEFREELRDLCRTEQKNLIIIGGNHDPDIHDRAAFLLDERIFMMHGDAIFQTGAPWGREFLYNKEQVFDIIHKYRNEPDNLRNRLSMNREIADQIAPVLSRQFGSNKYLNFLIHAAWPPSRPARILGAWILYKKYIRRFTRKYVPQAEVVITGHLHRRSIFQADKRCFINTGAYFQNATPWIVDIHQNLLTVSNLEAKKSIGRSVASFSLK